MTSYPDDPLAFVQSAIETFVRDSPENRHKAIDGAPMFDAPLVRVAAGDDPLWEEYHRIIGPYHMTPREVISHVAEPDADLSGVSVITWILPVAQQTRDSNRVQETAPSQRWAHTRWFGEMFNTAVRRHLEALLKDMGHAAVAPVSSGLWKEYRYENDGAPTSNWSERHAAYVAGQGTFSLNDGLITPRGIAHRCGSVVTTLPLPAAPRPYENHLANCLYFRTGGCMKCADRCPAGAISEQGHDKGKCREYLLETLKPYLDSYQVKIAGCGLCQVGVPCEDCIP